MTQLVLNKNSVLKMHLTPVWDSTWMPRSCLTSLFEDGSCLLEVSYENEEKRKVESTLLVIGIGQLEEKYFLGESGGIPQKGSTDFYFCHPMGKWV